jgi:hypothetical protein
MVTIILKLTSENISDWKEQYSGYADISYELFGGRTFSEYAMVWRKNERIRIL